MQLVNLLSENGSPVVAILLLLSILATAMILIKLFQFALLAWLTPCRSDSALAHWQRGEAEVAGERLQHCRHPVDRVLSVALHGVARCAQDLDLVREEVQRRALNEINRLRSLMRPLELIAAISPLLGLLGTVLGMIEAFQQLAAAGSQVNPALLSAGIWQALLTTAIGLSIAIPVVVMHGFLERQVEKVRQQIEDRVTQVFTRDVMFRLSEQPVRDFALGAAKHAA